MPDESNAVLIDHACFEHFFHGGDDAFHRGDSWFLGAIDDVRLEDEVSLGRINGGIVGMLFSWDSIAMEVL